MRILVTPHGTTQIGLLQAEYEMVREAKERERLRQIIEKEEKQREIKLKKQKEKSSVKKFVHEVTSDRNITTSVIEEVSVKQKKVPIPKFLQEKYNQQKEMLQEESIIMPTIPSTLSNAQKSMGKNGSKKKFLNVKDILKPETLSSLKKDKATAKRIKEINSFIDTNSFRTNYAEKDVMAELEEKLDVDIDLNMINLIKYLHEKKQVSENFIKQFESFSEEKLNKLNKICQIMSFKNEMEKLDQDLIKEKMRINENKLKVLYKETMDNAQLDIKFCKKILSNYNQSVNKNAIYGDLFRETKKIWDKGNVQRLQRRTFKEGINPDIDSDDKGRGRLFGVNQTAGFPTLKNFMNSNDSMSQQKLSFSKLQIKTPLNLNDFNI